MPEASDETIKQTFKILKKKKYFYNSKSCN